MKVLLPLDIPYGRTCKFEGGEVCRLFLWGHKNSHSSCRGWNGSQIIENFFKHPACFALQERETHCSSEHLHLATGSCPSCNYGKPITP